MSPVSACRTVAKRERFRREPGALRVRGGTSVVRNGLRLESGQGIWLLRKAFALIGFMLASCHPPSGVGPSQAPSASAEKDLRGTPVTSLSGIEGIWDVADFNGYVPPRLNGSGWHEAFVMVGRGGDLSFRIGCNYSGSSGKLDANGIFHASPGDRITTLVLCDQVRMKRDGQFFGLFGRAPTFAMVGEDRLLVRAGSDRLLLERPALRQQANIASLAEMQGEWQVMAVSEQSAGGGSGFGLSDLPGLIRFGQRGLSLTNCAQETVPFRYVGGKLVMQTGDDLPPCMAASFRKASDLSGAYRMVGNVLSDEPVVELGAGGILVLSAGRHALILARPEPKQDGPGDRPATGSSLMPPPSEPPPPPPLSRPAPQ